MGGSNGIRGAGVRVTLFGVTGFLLVFGLRPPDTSASWYIETVDSVGSAGLFNSLALDADGNPHISYQEDSKADLKYAYRDQMGWHAQNVDSVGKAGEYTSIAVDGLGCPHISYATEAWNWNPVLRYVYRIGPAWHIENVDSATHRIIGRHSSLVLDRDGKPHISYADWPQTGSSDRKLKYARRDGGTWQFDVVDPGPYAGSYSSLALDQQGLPHVAYQADWELRYAYWDGLAWRTETVDCPDSTVVEVGMHSSLALDSGGNPHISYCECRWDYPWVGEYRLRYASNDGQTWHIETIDGWGCEASHTGLALDEYDRPYISYYYIDWYAGTRELRLASYDGAAWTIAIVDSGFGYWWQGNTSLALDESAFVHISYYDNGPKDLRYAFGTPLQGGEDPGRFVEVPDLRLQAESPCFGEARIVLYFPHPACVSLGIYDLIGRCVHLLHDGFVPEGSHRMTWNGLTGVGSRAGSGVYICSARAGEIVASTRIVFCR